jgi:hypothetical protein
VLELTRLELTLFDRDGHFFAQRRLDGNCDRRFLVAGRGSTASVPLIAAPCAFPRANLPVEGE